MAAVSERIGASHSLFEILEKEEVILNAKNALEIDRKFLFYKENEKWSWNQILKKYHVPVIEKMRENYESKSYK